MNLEEFKQKLSNIFSTFKKDKEVLSVDELKIKYLGRKSEFVSMLRLIGTLPISERKEAGKIANEFKNKIEKLLEKLESENNQPKNYNLDVTLPGKKVPVGHMHITTQTIREVADIFKKLGFYQVRYPEVEWDYYAFTALNFPEDHPARDEWETFFIDSKPINSKYGARILTPHTSSGQVREMEKRKPPIRMINISRVYRRQMSVRHLMNFYQFEGLVIDKNINIGHLKGILDFFVKKFIGPDTKYRIRPYHFPFTEPSFEVDVWLGKENKMAKDGWLEIGGAGMVHPNVLRAGGIDPNEYSGYAFGWGIERNKLSIGGINLEDIRILYQTDIRFLEQF
ncbi:MAG: phenylalanine--tRNA ligase alpha subunit [Candidatus Dojkabacteria bacterium]|nr:MAG: phenylalanine--tRNA ligase alpha subunit [Candidatus Dojkabacteria bacterium]